MYCSLADRSSRKPGEAYAEVAIQPGLERGAARTVVEQVDALADLADRDDAEMQEILGSRRDPFLDPAARPALHEFGNHVRIQEEAGKPRYHLMVLVVSRLRVR